jgi:uncharacterized protein (DUF4415 family)
MLEGVGVPVERKGLFNMPDTLRPDAGGTNWAVLRSRSDAEIERLAAEDADNPATTEEDWADAVIGLPVLKTPVNAKFDADVVDWFKSQGRGYQTRMNAVLRRYMEADRRTD